MTISIKPEFGIGDLVMTCGVAEMYDEDRKFNQFVNTSFNRYIQKDWGDTCEEDVERNDYAVNHEERLLAVYKFSDDITIWIITEWDRSVTTILFPDEY